MVNALKTTLLLGLLTAFAVAVGGFVAGEGGMIVAFVIAAAMNVGAWFFSDTLAIRSSGAVPIAEVGGLQWLEDDVADLARRASMPKPRVYIVPHEASPNAFATGRSPDKGVVAVTAGLLRALDRRQVRGVLAHELGHIKHRDTLTSTVAATMAGVVTMLAGLARWGAIFGGFGGDREDRNPLGLLVVALVAPVVAAMIHMAVSRTREYAADARAAELTEDPDGMADALERIAGVGHRVPMQTGNEATHYIVNNFSGGLAGWFSTHPPIEERVARLRRLGRGQERPLGSAFPSRA